MRPRRGPELSREGGGVEYLEGGAARKGGGVDSRNMGGLRKGDGVGDASSAPSVMLLLLPCECACGISSLISRLSSPSLAFVVGSVVSGDVFGISLFKGSPLSLSNGEVA